jgi:hypothetical protein
VNVIFDEIINPLQSIQPMFPNPKSTQLRYRCMAIITFDGRGDNTGHYKIYKRNYFESTYHCYDDEQFNATAISHEALNNQIKGNGKKTIQELSVACIYEIVSTEIIKHCNEKQRKDQQDSVD